MSRRMARCARVSPRRSEIGPRFHPNIAVVYRLSSARTEDSRLGADRRDAHASTVTGRLHIERLDGGALELDGTALARAFFTRDPSSVGVGSFDGLAGRTARDRIELADVQALNRTMRARSAHSSWAALIDTSLPWLEAIDPTLDLIRASDAHWERERVTHLLTAAMNATVGPMRGVSVATKMLHLKRPQLFPVLDALVAQMIGSPPLVSASPAIEVVAHLRRQGRENLGALLAIQDDLDRRGYPRSLVRILDAVLWLSHPAAGAASTLRRWRCDLAKSSASTSRPADR